jgi:hypothetical protein
VALRRQELQRGIEAILSDLASSQIQNLVDSILEHRRTSKDNGQKIGLDPFLKLAISHSNYSMSQKRIFSLIGLDNLVDPKYWSQVVSDPEPHMIFSIRSSISFAKDHLPKIMKLIEQDYVSYASRSSGSAPEFVIGKSVLSIFLIEEKDEFSTPRRLVFLLESIEKMYSSVAEITGERDDGLVVIACDSGSDKSFDFMGLASLMEQIKETLLAIWDRKIFYRQMQAQASMELIAASLPLVQQVESMSKAGSLAPEQAEIIKRKLVDGCIKFLEAGAATEDMEAVSSHSPRLLMKPQHKLLAAPQPSNSSQSSEIGSIPAEESVQPEQGLSENEISQLRTLMGKAGLAPPSRGSSRATNRSRRKE